MRDGNHDARMLSGYRESKRILLILFYFVLIQTVRSADNPNIHT